MKYYAPLGWSFVQDAASTSLPGGESQCSKRIVREPSASHTSDRAYIRFAALGDSATHGVGDPADDGWRGWARILAGSIADYHDVYFCNLAINTSSS